MLEERIKRASLLRPPPGGAAPPPAAVAPAPQPLLPSQEPRYFFQLLSLDEICTYVALMNT